MGRIVAAIRYLLPRIAAPRCAACGGQRSAERRLISGPRFYVCETCIDLVLAAIGHDVTTSNAWRLVGFAAYRLCSIK